MDKARKCNKPLYIGKSFILALAVIAGCGLVGRLPGQGGLSVKAVTEKSESKPGYYSAMKAVKPKIKAKNIKVAYQSHSGTKSAVIRRPPEAQAYLNDERPTDWRGEVGVLLFCLVATGIAYRNRRKYGENEQLPKSEYNYPPADCNPLAVGLIYRGRVDVTDVLSLLVDFAGKGYLGLQELDDKVTRWGVSDYRITKLREYTGPDKIAVTFFEQLFTEPLNQLKADSSVIKLDDGGAPENLGTVTFGELFDDFYRIPESIAHTYGRQKKQGKNYSPRLRVIRENSGLLALAEYIAVCAVSFSNLSSWLFFMILMIFAVVGLYLIVDYSAQAAKTC